ncbi:MAG: DsbA family protein [Patescibacteria group bacterium]
MNSEENIRKIFLFGSALLLIFIVGGLIWAVMAGPGEGGGTVDPNLAFNDAGAPSLGPEDAKVTVRIYSDFQCPACKLAELELKPIMEEFKDRIRFIWNDFPLPELHPNAPAAALAARCAQEQGKFWEYHDELFANQQIWSAATSSAVLTEMAVEIGLNPENFIKCLNSAPPKEKVNNDYIEAVNFGLNSTPTFFVNRTKYSGAMDRQAWVDAINAELFK